MAAIQVSIMTSNHEVTSGRWRSITAGLLAVLLFFYEQTLLAQPTEVPVIRANAQMVTVNGDLQWLLTLVVLAVSGAFFFAAVRGIRVRVH
jgi:hypothetical protein